jgi:hypothetical protein
MGISLPKGMNLGLKQQLSQDPGHLLAALTAEMIPTNGLNLEETLVPGRLLNSAGRSEALTIVSRVASPTRKTQPEPNPTRIWGRLGSES